MIRSTIHRTILPLAFILVWQTPVLSASSRNLVLAPGSALWLTGDSTLHPFTSRTTELNIVTQLDPQTASSAASSKELLNNVLHQNALKQLDLSIPVKTLKSKESGLDKNMYKALKADQFPTIDFHLTHYEVMAATSSTAALPVRASGTLRIAGQEQPITVNGAVTPGSEGMRVEGKYLLLMTDYGIKPPTMMMGTIKVKNPVTIQFDLQLGAGSAEPSQTKP